MSIEPTMPATAKQFDLVALGEAMVEFNQQTDTSNSVSSSASSSNLYLQGFGGDTSNSVIAAARQGARTAYLTALGNDSFGDMLLQLWLSENVNIDGVRSIDGGNTGIYFVTHSAQGHQFSYRRANSAAALMQAESLWSEAIANTEFFLISGISQAISETARDTVRTALQIAKAAGTRIAYDSNLRLKLWSIESARAALIETLPQCDEFLPGLDEMQLLTGLQTAADIISWSHQHGAKHVVLKMGAQGAIASDGHRLETIAGHRVTAVDATGAGDCFNGNYLTQRARGRSMIDSAKWACVAGALSTTGYGAVKPLPTEQQVRTALGT